MAREPAQETSDIPPDINFRDDIAVELIRASASDSDVVDAARVSTQGTSGDGGAMNEGGPGLIRFLMRERHGSPFEHTSFTFFVSAPIFVWREHMRHRMASYNEESGRYRELQPHFYVPNRDRALVQQGKPGAYTFVAGSTEQHLLLEGELQEACRTAYRAYQSLLQSGIAREVARMCLPVNTYSTAYVTMNARGLMNFLSLRRSADSSTYPSYPQREIEIVAEQYEEHFARAMPVTHAAFVEGGRVCP